MILIRYIDIDINILYDINSIYSILYECVKLSAYFLLYCSQQNQRLDIGLSKNDQTWGDCTSNTWPLKIGNRYDDMIPFGNLT